jgi:hypothetical protein
MKTQNGMMVVFVKKEANKKFASIFSQKKCKAKK